ncbi:hypothetical protein DFP73DRAFT_631029 [Morchella snyderi]|nr:hypothetical protein DFP73DRAFT_631029 [Morchella snyderi]
MSRPGPKPSFENNFGNERLAIHEEMIRHLAKRLDDTEALDMLLEKLDDLNARRQGHCCSICHKSYSDSKGLRRHVLGSTDEGHMELKDTLRTLCCSRCGRRFSRREQVTKHESSCSSNGSASTGEASGEASAGTKRAWTESEEEPDRVNTTKLPRIMPDPASPFPAYFSRADLMGQ